MLNKRVAGSLSKRYLGSHTSVLASWESPKDFRVRVLTMVFKRLLHPPSIGGSAVLHSTWGWKEVMTRPRTLLDPCEVLNTTPA